MSEQEYGPYGDDYEPASASANAISIPRHRIMIASRRTRPSRGERRTLDSEPRRNGQHAEHHEDSHKGRPFTNGHLEYLDKKTRVIPLPMEEILSRLRSHAGDWPRRVGSKLFVHHGQKDIAWLGNAAALYGWLGSTLGTINWHSATGCVTKPEMFAEVKRLARNYTSIESLPHEPAVPDVYYSCRMVEPGNGEHLEQLLDRFCPASEIDRDLILAAMMTLIWGGPGGTRPAFVIDSSDGRGVGKSKLAELLGVLVGGALDLRDGEQIASIKSRLLSPEGIKKRVAIIDNVKSDNFSWADLESMITAPFISGKEMYVGEAARPNVLTWLVTLNSANLSTDLAQRSVIIKLTTPQRSDTWEEDTSNFIREHQWQIIADIVGMLRSKPQRLSAYTRWATWERDILSRLPDPSGAQQVILERQQAADVEDEEASLIEECFVEWLARLGYTPRTATVHIPSAICTTWMNTATGKRLNNISAPRFLKQLIGAGRLPQLQVNPCKTHGRGFLWTGPDAAASSIVSTDLKERYATESLRQRG